MALGLALAALTGISLGLLGGGGSILTVPILVYVLGVPAKSAIAISLPIVGGTSLVGAVAHWRAGRVQLPVALSFGGVAMAAAYVGARVGVFVPSALQLSLLALVMVGAAVAMLRGSRGGGRAGPAAEAERAMERAVHAALWQILLAGAGVGLLTGLVGIGGGFLIVPALVLLGRLPMKQAVGTSLVVIALNSAAGLLGYLGRVPIDWMLTAGFTAIAAAGIVLGAALVGRVPAATLKRAFGVFVLVVGLMILYRNRSAFGFGTAAGEQEKADATQTQNAATHRP